MIRNSEKIIFFKIRMRTRRKSCSLMKNSVDEMRWFIFVPNLYHRLFFYFIQSFITQVDLSFTVRSYLFVLYNKLCPSIVRLVNVILYIVIL